MGAFIAGTIIYQASVAFADDGANPFRAIWDSIDSLNGKTDSLQAQINELRAQTHSSGSTENLDKALADVHVSIVSKQVEENDGTHIDLSVKNDGPSDAVGVKLTAFYKMSVIHIQYISSSARLDLSRGIIKCELGTIKSDEDLTITVIATSTNDQSIDESTTLTADVSSITDESNYTNNHQVLVLDAAKDSPQILQNPEESEDNVTEQVVQNTTNDSNQTTTTDSETDTTNSSNEDRVAA